MLELNPLDVLNKRKLEYLPFHFSKVKVSDNDRYDYKMEDWIKSKLNGRYSIGQYPAVDTDNKFKVSTYVAFEEQKELTYFMLACPFLRRT